MTDVTGLVAEATAKLRAEAERLRTEIEQKERGLEDELAPMRLQLGELDQAIARIEGKPVQASGTRSSQRRAPRGRNRDVILGYLTDHPSARPTEIAEATAIKKPTAYATLAKLVEDGLLEKKAEGADGVRYARKTEKQR